MKAKALTVLAGLVILTALFALPAAAQDKAPKQIPGTVVYIPFPVKITLDGDFSDWAGIPVQNVATGPKKSPSSKQSPSFDFAVASDEVNLYVMMKIVDAKIVTGKHGTDFWNEDSMEFYVNFTTDFAAKKYAPGMAQININPGNIGKKAGDALVLFGTNKDTIKVSANVVKTADGWAFEAAIPLTGKAEHGRTIGFQAHANGTTAADRDTKLIWSKNDTGDGSWSDPSKFGKAVFFKVGSTDTPVAK